MLLSKEGAEGKWCPFGRVAHQPGLLTPEGITSVNRMGQMGTNCLANACMCWRWAGWGTEFGTYAQNPIESEKHGPRLGYCGLAGKPFGVG